MKILKTIVYILLAILIIFLILAYIAPTTTVISRTVSIDAPQKLVYTHTNSLESIDSWSPWSEVDTTAESKFTGESGTVGSEHYWNGNDEIGEGYNTITAIEEGKSVSTHLRFVRPWPGEADSEVSVVENEEGGTDATWSFTSETSYPMNISNLFVDMDKMLGPEFAKGLGYLKTMVEEKMQGMVIKGQDIKIGDIQERHYIGARNEVSISELERYFAVHMANVGAAFGKLGAIQEAIPSAVYFKWDEENQRTELLAGMFTESDKGKVEGLDYFNQPAAKAVIIEYFGDYSQSADAHYAIEEFLGLTGYESTGVAIEDYLVGPGQEGDPEKWKTRIIYPLK